jgi:hypothetical protein
MKEIHVEREEAAFMCHTVGTQPSANSLATILAANTFVPVVMASFCISKSIEPVFLHSHLIRNTANLISPRFGI